MSRILGLDYGERRLGFALSDPDEFLATPLCVVHCRSQDEAVREVERVCGQAGAERLVVGLPILMDGSRGGQARNVLAFVEKLTPKLSIPIETWDERLSTRAAENVLIEAGSSRRRRKEVVDKLAAQIMLQNYLDARAASRRPGLA